MNNVAHESEKLNEFLSPILVAEDIELKGKNDVTSLRCAFNVIIVGNAVPQLKLDGDESAWRRRVRWIKCRNFKPVHHDPDFAEKLLAQEGSGILNWILTGAAALLSDNGPMPCGGLQSRRIDYLIGSADPLEWFVDSCVDSNKGTDITLPELYAAFTQFSEAMEWTPWPERRFQQEIGETMVRKLHVAKRRDVKRNGKSQVGFCHVAFKQE